MSMDYEGYKQLWYVEVVHALPIFLRNSLRLTFTNYISENAARTLRSPSTSS